MHRIRSSITTYLHSRPLNPLSQQIPKSLPFPDLFNQRKNSIHISPAKVKAVRINVGDDSFFKQLESKSDATPCAYGVEAIIVAKGIGINHKLLVRETE